MHRSEEKIVCISANDNLFSVVCEGSIVYQFSSEEKFSKQVKIDFFKYKKINHVCHSASNLVFASLFNQNKSEDVIYQFDKNSNYNKVEIDSFVRDNRIMNVYSGGESVYVLLGNSFINIIF